MVEEFLDGQEASFFALVTGRTCIPLGSAQVGNRGFNCASCCCIQACLQTWQEPAGDAFCDHIAAAAGVPSIPQRYHQDASSASLCPLPDLACLAIAAVLHEPPRAGPGPSSTLGSASAPGSLAAGCAAAAEV